MEIFRGPPTEPRLSYHIETRNLAKKFGQKFGRKIWPKNLAKNLAKKFDQKFGQKISRTKPHFVQKEAHVRRPIRSRPAR
jgi:hypothetical protein